MKVPGTLRDWAQRHRRQLARVSAGLALYEAFNLGYDFVLYPATMLWLGVLWGAILMAAGSLASCAVLFWLYDRQKIDWLGAHAIGQIKHKDVKNRLEHWLAWISSPKHTWRERTIHGGVFILLNSYIDPLIVAVHCRQRHFTGLQWRDWRILLGAVTAANCWWIAKCGLLVGGLQWLYGEFTHGG